jgi:hypothetical protein
MRQRASLRFVTEKLDRCEEHRMVLHDEVSAYIQRTINGETYEVIQEQNAKESQYLSRIRIIEPVPTIRWGVLLGDLVHQGRSALDVLIEQLTVNETGHALEDTAFPVSRVGRSLKKSAFDMGLVRRAKSKHFGEPVRGSGRYMIRGLPRGARHIVERLQPYHRKAEFRASLLGLHELWNIDKHRVPPVVALALALKGWNVRGPDWDRGIAGLIMTKQRFRLEDGEIVAVMPWKEPREPELHIQAQLSVEVSLAKGPWFEKGSPMLGRDIRALAFEFVRDARNIVNLFKGLLPA